MSEIAFQLSSPDGHLIGCVLNQAGAAPSSKVMVIAPGFDCDMRDSLYEKAQKFFTSAGYDVLRFNFDGMEEHERKVKDITPLTMIQDMQHVLAHVAPQYKDVFLAGHSFGGLAAALLHPANVRAMSLWDSTFYPDTGFHPPEAVYDEHINAYHFGNTIIGKEMVAQSNSLTSDILVQAAEKITVPTQFLFAENGTAREGDQEFIAALRSASDQAVIARADHFFSVENTAEDLFRRSLCWLNMHATRAPESPTGKPSDKTQPHP